MDWSQLCFCCNPHVRLEIRAMISRHSTHPDTQPFYSRSGSSYLIGGVGLYLAGILEFILGNTFPFGEPFLTFSVASADPVLPQSSSARSVGSGAPMDSSFSRLKPSPKLPEERPRSRTTTVSPSTCSVGQLLRSSTSSLLSERQSSYTLPSLNTDFNIPSSNVVFVLLFFFLEITFDVLVLACTSISIPPESPADDCISADLRLGYGELTNVSQILKVAGAFGFLTAAMGW